MDKETEINKIFDEFENKLNQGIECSESLGSCQYKSIEDTHFLVTSLLRVMNLKDFEKAFGITYSGIATQMKEIERDCYEILIHEFSINSDHEVLMKNDPDYKDKFDHKNKRLKLLDYIEITRDQAWDLWSAYLGPLWSLEITTEIKDSLPTFGPILNMEVQSDNFIIGVQLAYLTHFFNIPLSAWDGYDT